MIILLLFAISSCHKNTVGPLLQVNISGGKSVKKNVISGPPPVARNRSISRGKVGLPHFLVGNHLDHVQASKAPPTPEVGI